MKVRGEGIFLGGRFSEPSGDFPDGSWMVTIADDEGDTIKCWANGASFPATFEWPKMQPVTFEANIRERQQGGKSFSLLAINRAGGK